MCLKVARLFGSTPNCGLRLPGAYDCKRAEANKKVMQRVARILPVGPAEELLA